MYKDNELLNEVLTSLLDAILFFQPITELAHTRIVGFHRK